MGGFAELGKLADNEKGQLVVLMGPFKTVIRTQCSDAGARFYC